MKGKHLGELEELVLLSVASLEGDSYGIAIQDFLLKHAKRNTTIGSLHSTITRLEEKGYLDSQFGPASNERGGRRKRIYSLTSAGKESLLQVKLLRDELWSLSSNNLSIDG